ncbi:MAG: MFS transporter [Anaerolineae bacterium]|nr:MFS transporter [Anaerolineae bacterium]MCI0610926.1 MFS transporter [Anaerolineae bacterium]
MAKLQLNSYRDIMRDKNFLAFWSGFTLSSIGDSLTRVALTWLVFEETKSAQALGILTIAYTAPILLGGFFAGPLLDRFGARRVMIFDNLIRGLVFALIPILHALGRLEIWHIYVFAAIYGALMMISLAGGPTLIPSIVKNEQLETANAMETLSYTVSGVIGPPLAGLLIVWIGTTSVVIFDAVSYFIFAFTLLGMSVKEPVHESTESENTSYGIMDAVRLMVGNKVILSTTLMFMAFNVGLGALTVFLPLVSDQIAAGSSEIFGALLGAMALGEVISAWLAGSLILKMTLGKRIALAQILSGLSLALLLSGATIWAVAIGLFLLGFFSAPLTIWAQTLRMQVIPPELRGRTFALLRTLMQGATPLGGALAGFLLPVLGMQFMIGLSSFVIGAPGLAGMQITELKQAGGE